MNWASKLTREELLADIEVFASHTDFAMHRDRYLRNAVHDLDLELALRLLEAEADPNACESWGDTLLHHLACEYRACRSTKGSKIIEALDLLLRFGADPNKVGANNWRAVDGCIDRNEAELVSLFIEYGADPKQREFL